MSGFPSRFPGGSRMRRRVAQLERNRERTHGERIRLSMDDREYVWVLLHDPCSYCGSSDGMQTDHIDAAGPSGWPNFTSACTSCNTAKQALPLLRFMLGQKIRRLREALTAELTVAQPEHFNRMRRVKVFADRARVQ